MRLWNLLYQHGIKNQLDESDKKKRCQREKILEISTRDKRKEVKYIAQQRLCGFTPLGRFTQIALRFASDNFA